MARSPHIGDSPAAVVTRALVGYASIEALFGLDGIREIAREIAVELSSARMLRSDCCSHHFHDGQCLHCLGLDVGQRDGFGEGKAMRSTLRRVLAHAREELHAAGRDDDADRIVAILTSLPEGM